MIRPLSLFLYLSGGSAIFAHTLSRRVFPGQEWPPNNGPYTLSGSTPWCGNDGQDSSNQHQYDHPVEKADALKYAQQYRTPNLPAITIPGDGGSWGAFILTPNMEILMANQGTDPLPIEYNQVADAIDIIVNACNNGHDQIQGVVASPANPQLWVQMYDFGTIDYVVKNNPQNQF